jgi:uncharacterized protein (DUF1697 family)
MRIATDPGKRVYVALIRGINVGGRSIISMADLRKWVESLGLTDVATYIQSGNVVFSTAAGDPERWARLLEERISAAMGFRTTAFVLSPSELKRASAGNPFDPARSDKEQRSPLMFLSAAPDAAHRRALMALQGEEYRFLVKGRIVYLAYSRKYDGNRRSLDFEKILGVAGTMRSWKVVDKLIELSSLLQRRLDAQKPSSDSAPPAKSGRP